MGNLLEPKEINRLISLSKLNVFWDNYAQKHKVVNDRQRHNIVHKHAFFHIVRENTSLSLSSIGSVLGKDHATVLNACRNHESNYKWDSNYRLVYDNMLIEIEDFLLENGIVPKPILYDGGVSDVHFKFLSVSRRLRDVMKEFEMYRKSVSVDLKRVNIIKKHAREQQEKISRLEAELKRVKNLL